MSDFSMLQSTLRSTLLYLLIYLLLRLEDNALLVGAVASFATVAVAMYCTRRIDWYSSLAEDVIPERGGVIPGAGDAR